MDKNDVLLAIVIGVVVVASIIGIVAYNYIEKKDYSSMAQSGLEQCKKTPDWKNSENIWVKDCNKYMETYMKLQEK